MHSQIKSVICLLSIMAIAHATAGQLFDIKAPPTNIKPGINKVPPLIPVMSPGDFQGQVKSLSDENRKSMVQQGFDTIKQQRDALPSTDPGSPPPSSASTTTRDDDSTKSAAPSASTAPAPATSNTDETDTTAPTEPTDNNTGPAANNSSTQGNSPASGGSLNIQY